MAFETKQELLHRCMEMEKPACPHCEKEMTLWEVPEVTFSDGLGWGTPYLFVCFNDECPSFKQGWDHMKETMEFKASYRCIQEPGRENFEYMPVFSPTGAQGQILDDAVLLEREALEERTKQGFSILTDYYITKDWDEILKMLLDPNQPPRVRFKAAEMVGELGESEATEHLVNHKFPTPVLQKAVDEAVAQLHERHYTRECPYCAEIIKKRAKLCKHCQKELSRA
ncbi:MAG: zinc ribbon domain-containing protein [Desulfobacteraceae bacterium]|nr:MAG: zinc ribbon domain-containing protein [Desulfobacteraceae bacterium]